MKIVFYSDRCEFCKKMLDYLDKHNIKSLFQLVNIDNTELPDGIDIVPTIIDTELTQPLKGKQVFEYLVNIKYFNNPTNNIEYIKELPPNPDIPDDKLAIKGKSVNLELSKAEQPNNNLLFNNDNKEVSNSKPNKKLSVLMQLKRR